MNLILKLIRDKFLIRIIVFIKMFTFSRYMNNSSICLKNTPVPFLTIDENESTEQLQRTTSMYSKSSECE